MDPFSADVLARLRRDELLAEAHRHRLAASVPRARRRAGEARGAWREKVGTRLVEAALHLLVAVPERKPCCA